MTDNDTSAAAEAVLDELLRQAPAWRKFRALGQLNAMAQALALSDLRERYPQATEPEFRRFLTDKIRGKELAASIYGAHPLAKTEEMPADVA